MCFVKKKKSTHKSEFITLYQANIDPRKIFFLKKKKKTCPASHLVRCDYCACVHRDIDAKTIYRAALPLTQYLAEAPLQSQIIFGYDVTRFSHQGYEYIL